MPRMSWFWFLIGAVAGWFALPRVLGILGR